MKRKSWIWAIIFFLGLLFVILPDDGTTIVRLNENHGPSGLDLLGLILMLVGWAGLSYRVVTNWKRITGALGKNNARLLLILYCGSILGIVIALAVNIDWMLWISIAAASIINFSFVLIVFPRRALPF